MRALDQETIDRAVDAAQGVNARSTGPWTTRSPLAQQHIGMTTSKEVDESMASMHEMAAEIRGI
jgi:hypothetical protein